MPRFPLLLAPLVIVALSCGGAPESADHQHEWRSVLEHKKAAVSPAATPQQKQVYADSLHAFVARNPKHSRARDVYERIQLDFANDLSALGRHQDSIRFYRAVLSHDPDNKEALSGLAAAVDHLAVSRQKLLSLEKGMSQREVSRILGKPIPGWTLAQKRRGAKLEAWYYRQSHGGIAGVYFRNGELFAAEENSNARLSTR